MAADLVEEQLQRVGRRRRELGVVERGLLSFAPAIVTQLDVVRVQLLIEPTEVGFVELERLNELVDLREGDAAELLASVDQRGDGSPTRVAAAQGHTV